MQLTGIFKYPIMINSRSMGKYTIVVESKDGRVLKIDNVELDLSNIPPQGGMIRVTTDKIGEVSKGKKKE